MTDTPNTATLRLVAGEAFSVFMTMEDGVLSISATKLAPPVAAPKPAKAEALFAAQSLWNATPVNPVLGFNVMPSKIQTPWIEELAYSSRIFRAAATDGAVTIYGPKGGADLDIANQLETGTVVVPRFPAGVVPATGQDGHCEILDPIDGTLHSFFQLRQTGGKWCATKYAKTSWRGSGFGTVSNPDNVRAAGCSTAGGLLLASELAMDVVPHALAIGMDKNAFVPGPIYPATLEDLTGATTYKGVKGQQFPMGALMMLPANFDAEALALPESRTIARTLKKHGAYIVDATVGSMNFYAEIGSGWKDRDGKVFTPTPLRSMNLLSMRGPWAGYNGSKAFGRYDAATDLFQAEATTEPRTVRQLLYTHAENDPDRFKWKKQSWNLNPEPGVKYTVRAIGAGDITATLSVKKADYKANYGTTGALAPGKSATFTWPTEPGTVTEIYVDKPAGAAASIRLELVKVD